MGGFLDELKGLVEQARQETYPKVRNYLATTALNLGGKGADKDSKKILHEEGNYEATKRLGALLPPETAAGVTDLAYLGNEALTGTLAKLTGRPFFSDYGFRWKDVGINRRGQDRAIHELSAQNALRRAQLRETMRSVPEIPFGGKE